AGGSTATPERPGACRSNERPRNGEERSGREWRTRGGEAASRSEFERTTPPRHSSPVPYSDTRLRNDRPRRRLEKDQRPIAHAPEAERRVRALRRDVVLAREEHATAHAVDAGGEQRARDHRPRVAA